MKLVIKGNSYFKCSLTLTKMNMIKINTVFILLSLKMQILYRYYNLQTKD